MMLFAMARAGRAASIRVGVQPRLLLQPLAKPVLASVGVVAAGNILEYSLEYRGSSWNISKRI